jgi:hypothetical protein
MDNQDSTAMITPPDEEHSLIAGRVSLDFDA